MRSSHSCGGFSVPGDRLLQKASGLVQGVWHTRWVVVAAEPVTDVDITAADALLALDAQLHQAGADLFFAEMKGPVKDRLKRYELFTHLGTGNFFPTIEQAVERYLATHPVGWQGRKAEKD